MIEHKRDLKAKICHLNGKVRKRDNTNDNLIATIDSLNKQLHNKDIVIKHLENRIRFLENKRIK